MKTITTTVYEYDELPTEKAKERARDWFLQIECYSSHAWKYLRLDAERIGLEILSLDERNREGKFIDGAFNCAQRIKGSYGKECDTYKAAVKWEERVDELEEDHLHLGGGSDRYNEMLDATEADFLNDLLKAYEKMYEKEIEHQTSDEVVAETIRINGYTFTADGKRFG